LLEAACLGSLPLIQLLLKAGADANTANLAGETPLMHSAIHTSPEMARVLLFAGATVDSYDEGMGCTPLMFAGKELFF
jgi:ankyrin repeat protein